MNSWSPSSSSSLALVLGARTPDADGAELVLIANIIGGAYLIKGSRCSIVFFGHDEAFFMHMHETN